MDIKCIWAYCSERATSVVQVEVRVHDGGLLPFGFPLCAVHRSQVQHGMN